MNSLAFSRMMKKNSQLQQENLKNSAKSLNSKDIVHCSVSKVIAFSKNQLLQVIQ